MGKSRVEASLGRLLAGVHELRAARMGENHFAAVPTAMYGVVLLWPISDRRIERVIEHEA